MDDLILERTEKGLCPICNKNIIRNKNNKELSEIKTIKYKDIDLYICNKHYIQERNINVNHI